MSKDHDVIIMSICPAVVLGHVAGQVAANEAQQ
jgi:hypothetical protein